MNDGYLDADCAISALISLGVLKPADWKREQLKVQELYYPARFYHAEKKATVTLEILLFHTRHCITKSSIRILAAIYKIDLDQVLSACAL